MTVIFISSCELFLLTLHKLQGMYTGNHMGLGTKVNFLVPYESEWCNEWIS